MRFPRRQLLQAGLAAVPFAAARARSQDLQLDRDIHVGMIGLEGHFGEALALAKAHPRVHIAAVEITNEREEQRAAGEPLLQQAKRYGDYRELLAKERLDVVSICDQNWRRAESVAACLEKGLPTAAEKPLALELDDLRRLRKLADETGVPLTMLLPMRFDPPYVAMKQIVNEGRIGEPVQLSGQKSYQLGERPDWMKRRASFGGAIPYIGCHVVDLLRFVSGRDMVEVAAFDANVGFPQMGEVENTAAISYRLDNGGTATVRLDYLRPEAAPSHGDDRLRIAGLDGVVEYQKGEVTLVTGKESPHVITQFPETRRLFADFLDYVFNGAAPQLTVDEIFGVTKIVLRSQQAADAGELLRI